MNSDDFDKWLLHHQAAFPGVAKWINNIPAAIRPETLGLWEKTLSRIDLNAAISATDSMLAESDRPRFYEDHPAAILLRARRDRQPEQFRSRQIIDGEETYSCLLCRDMGCIICWHPAQVRHYRNAGELDARLPRTCAKACTCASGDQHAIAYGRFDARRWLPYGVHTESESLEQLRHFVANLKDSRREKAFDAFH